MQTRLLSILAVVGVLTVGYLLWDGLSGRGDVTGRAKDPLSAETEELTRWARTFQQLQPAKAEPLLLDSFHDDVTPEQRTQHVGRIVPLLVRVASAQPETVAEWKQGVVTATWKCRRPDGGHRGGQLSLLFSPDTTGRLRLLGVMP